MKLLFFGLLVGLSTNALAKDISIFEIRRNIPLSDDQPVYKDYYINAGESSGLKENMVVQVSRLVPIKSSAVGEAAKLLAPVGRLKIIHAQGELAVGRIFDLPGREFLPMLEQTGILIGDRIDIKTAKVEKKAPKTSDTFRAPASEDKFELNGELWEPPTTKMEIKVEPGAASVAPTPPPPGVTSPPAASSSSVSVPVLAPSEPAMAATTAPESVPVPTSVAAPKSPTQELQSNSEPIQLREVKAGVPSEIKQEAMISPAITPNVGATVE